MVATCEWERMLERNTTTFRERLERSDDNHRGKFQRDADVREFGKL
jgi:hypothetical protein